MTPHPWHLTSAYHLLKLPQTPFFQALSFGTSKRIALRQLSSDSTQSQQDSVYHRCHWWQNELFRTCNPKKYAAVYACYCKSRAVRWKRHQCWHWKLWSWNNSRNVFSRVAWLATTIFLIKSILQKKPSKFHCTLDASWEKYMLSRSAMTEILSTIKK